MLGWSAQLSYYFFLALFPALVCFVALASFVPAAHLTDMALRALTRLAPATVHTLVRRQLALIAESRSAGLLLFGIIGTVWSASAGMQAVIRTLNFAYHVPETRRWWRVRLRALALALVVPAVALAALALLLLGPVLGEHLAETFRLGGLFVWAWPLVRWPLVLVLVVAGLAFIYTVGPDAPHRFRNLILGSCLATAIWIAASLGLKWYVASFSRYERAYGAIGVTLVILVWFYVSALAMLVGAELNAVVNDTEGA